MQSKAGSVRELDMLDAFDEMASEYANKFGIPPFNVSHWDSLASFTDQVRVPLGIPAHRDQRFRPIVTGHSGAS